MVKGKMRRYHCEPLRFLSKERDPVLAFFYFTMSPPTQGYYKTQTPFRMHVAGKNDGKGPKYFWETEIR